MTLVYLAFGDRAGSQLRYEPSVELKIQENVQVKTTLIYVLYFIYKITVTVFGIYYSGLVSRKKLLSPLSVVLNCKIG